MTRQAAVFAVASALFVQLASPVWAADRPVDSPRPGEQVALNATPTVELMALTAPRAASVGKAETPLRQVVIEGKAQRKTNRAVNLFWTVIGTMVADAQ